MQNTLQIDSADPQSLSQILPLEIADLVACLPEALLTQDEETLTTLVDPSSQQKRIKIQFWDEYELAIKQERKLLLGNITLGVCTREYFLNFTSGAKQLAWLISPRPSYRLRIAELIDRGLDAVEDIFNIIPTEKTEISVRNLQLSALKMMDMRRHGGYTQRQEIKSLNKTTIETTTTTTDTVNLGEGSIQDLEKQVLELESKIESGRNQNGALLVRPPEVVIE